MTQKQLSQAKDKNLPALLIAMRRAGNMARELAETGDADFVPPTSIQRVVMTSKFITVDPEIHSGTPVFAGTRVPIKTLFDHLEAGAALAVFLNDFPSVSRELAVAVLEDARAALMLELRPA